MKKLYSVSVVLSMLLFTTNIFAQSASVMWVLSNTTQLTSVSVGNVTGLAESISAGSGRFGMSVFDYTADGQRLWEGTAGWIAGTEETTRYIQFDALPANENSFSVTNVSFNYGAAGIDHNIQSNTYYSTDGWVTRTLLNPSPLAYPGSGMSPFTKDISVTITSGSIFSVRIYPYSILNSSPMAPTFAVHNNVVISGSTAAKKNCDIHWQTTDGTIGSIKWGKSVLLTVRLQETGPAGNTNLPGRKISFSRESDTCDCPIAFIGSGTTDASGVVSIAYTIPQDSASSSFKAPQDSVTHTIRAVFAGDTNYYTQSGTGLLTVVRHVTSLVVAPTTVVFGQEVVLTATLIDNDESGKGVSNQELKFYIISPGTIVGDTTKVYIGSGTTNSSGVASIIFKGVVSTLEGTDTAMVSFAGDGNYSAKNGTGILTITKKNCVLQVTNVAGKWGKSVVLTAKLQESGLIRNTDLPNQELKFYKISPGTREGDTVEVYINSGKTDTNGVTSVMYTIPSDSVAYKFDPQSSDSVLNSIRVEFAGNANYSAQNGVGILTVVRHVTSILVPAKRGIAGQSIKLEGTLTDNDNSGKGVSNQLLKFSINGLVVGSGTTDAGGVAIVSYTLPQDSVAATHTITAVYTGDANYSLQSGTGTLNYTLTGIENNQTDIPTKFDLSQNYPNPFNPTSTIKYDIPKTGFVNISVYDILGKEIKVLVNEEKNPGHYEIIFDAREVASGIYFYTIRTAEFTQSRKMILLK